ncbi:MAG: hypothetical protein ACFE0O_15250 [Opitutales bacterium]
MSAQSSKPDPKGKPAQADERHYVDVDDSPDSAAEEKLLQFWDRNKGPLITGLVLVVAVIGAVQGLKVMRQSHQAAVQEAWQAATVSGDYATFLATYPEEPLAGLAHLEQGHGAFSEQAYAEAEAAYRAAAPILGDSPLAGRARLGAALALYMQGETDRAAEAFAALAEDTTILDGIRAEAAFNRAIMAIEADEGETFQRYFELIESLPHASAWSNRIRYYEDLAPDADN